MLPHLQFNLLSGTNVSKCFKFLSGIGDDYLLIEENIIREKKFGVARFHFHEWKNLIKRILPDVKRT